MEIPILSLEFAFAGVCPRGGRTSTLTAKALPASVRKVWPDRSHREAAGERPPHLRQHVLPVIELAEVDPSKRTQLPSLLPPAKVPDRCESA